MPDITKKIMFCLDKVDNPFASPLANTMPHAITKITMVRIAVAKLEFTFVMPIFANMAVSEANNADNKA